MSFWSRRKADEDPRDIRIRELTALLGTERADHAKTRAEWEATNRWGHSEQRARQRAEATHGYLMAQKSKQYADSIALVETQRDRALARLTEVSNANVDALLDELGAVKAALKKAEEDKEVLAADKADLRAQLMRADADHAELSGLLATAEERIAGYEVKA